MPRFQTDSDARRLGEALAVLRRRRRLSQAEAGQRIGITSQGWGLYEAGRRPGLFRPDVQRRLTSALDATPEDLALQVGSTLPSALPERGVQSSGRPFDTTGAPSRRFQLSTDELAPWAASGVILEYVPGRWPRRDQGCVIETVGGTLTARLYKRIEGDELVLCGGPGGLDAEERLPRPMIRSVSAVTARREPE